MSAQPVQQPEEDEGWLVCYYCRKRTRAERRMKDGGLVVTVRHTCEDGGATVLYTAVVGGRAQVVDHGITRIGPGARRTDPDTSKMADAMRTSQRRTGRVKMLEVFHSAGENGLTADEAGSLTGMLNGCYWKRVSELREMGLIEPTGQTRKGMRKAAQMVSRITHDGEAVIAARKDSGLYR